MGRKRSSAGVTLIELLIAVSLVGLLSLGILMAMRVGLNAMVRSNENILANRRSVGAHRVLEQQIGGLMPVRAACGLLAGAPTLAPFFQGDLESMRFVSSYSLQEASRGRPQMLEFQVIPGENGRGVRLVVNEYLYAGPFSTAQLCLGVAPDPVAGRILPQFRPIVVTPSSFVLADKLAGCRMMYLEGLADSSLERWVPRWVKPEFPRAIRIEMLPLEPLPSRVPPLTITVPVRVDRDPMVEYTN